MAKPARSRRGQEKNYSRRNRKARNGDINWRNSRSQARRQQKMKPRWQRSATGRRNRKTCSMVTSRIRRKSNKRHLAARRTRPQRLRANVNNIARLDSFPVPRNRNSRAKSNKRNNYDMQMRATTREKYSQRKRRQIEIEVEEPCKKPRLSGREIALTLSTKRGEDFVGSFFSNGAPRESDPPDSELQNPDASWNLIKGWEEHVRKFPPAYRNNPLVRVPNPTPAEQRSASLRVKKMRGENIGPPRPYVAYDANMAERYLNTAVNKLYVYNPGREDGEPFGRAGFFHISHQEHYFKLAMRSKLGKNAVKALNDVNLYLQEVNFEYELTGDTQIKHLACRWKGRHLVEIFKPNYIVVGLKYSTKGNSPEFMVNGCFPKRKVDAVYWALRGPYTQNAVYNINYTG